MLDMSNMKLASTAVAKSTARGAASTSTWFVVIWYITVSWLTLFDPNDSSTVVLVGAITTVWAGALRALERKYPWLGFLLLSDERPAYSAELDAINQTPAPAPNFAVDANPAVVPLPGDPDDELEGH